MRWLLATLLLGSSPDDPASRALYDAIRDRVGNAASLRAEFAVTLVNDGQDFGSFRGILKIKPPDRWVCDVTLVRRDQGEEERRWIVLQSDGRRVRIVEGALPSKELPLNARTFVDWLRRSCVDSSFSLIELADAHLLHRGVLEKPLELGSFRSGGSETLEGRAAEILEYSVRTRHLAALPQEGTVKVWVDRETKLPIQRKLTLNRLVWSEAVTLSFDEVPDGDFSLQSRRRLARAQMVQLAESVRLFELFTGRPPDSLEELARKPADLDADLFWPRDGFLLGGLPRDPWGRPFGLQVQGRRCTIVCRAADGQQGGQGEAEDLQETIAPATGSAVGAPSDRLAALKGYQDAYGEIPREEKQLRKQEAWMQVWPEGGWLPAGKVERYRTLFTERQVRVQVTDATMAISAAELTDPERHRLDEIAQPRVRASERLAVAALLDQLGDDDFDVRERAQRELRERGPGILGMAEQRLKKETDTEVLYRLQTLLRALPKPEPAWPSLFGSLGFYVLSEDVRPDDLRANETLAARALKLIAAAEVDFRSGDRDGNGVNDFWTGDLAGLHLLTRKGERFALRLIDVTLASADAAPLPRENGATPAPPLPERGYWFRALKKDRSVRPPEDYAADTSDTGGPKTYNRNRFGFVAYPAEYGVSGMRTLIINEAMSVLGKDVQGEPVDDWPDDVTLKREWTLLK